MVDYLQVKKKETRPEIIKFAFYPKAITYLFIYTIVLYIETRALQAQSFNDPNSDIDVLVASDAVGMGLNL